MGDKRPLIVGFMGVATAGKTTAAHHIRGLFPGKAAVLSFASPLKKAVADLFMFSMAQVYGHLKDTVDPRWGFSPREAMRKLGTDCVRNMLMEDFWVRRMEQEIASRTEPVILIDDVRFRDEALLPLRVGNFLSKIILINRAGLSAGEHASEQPPVDLTDETWNNGGTLADYLEFITTSEVVDMVGRFLNADR